VADDLLHSPLHDRHVALGARLAPFAGWEMPLQYTGVVEEHTAVRERVGLFDVSHLGTLDVHGRGAAAVVDRVMTNDLARIGPGQAQYTLCCTEQGGVVDDLIVYLESPQRLRLVPNAANAAAVAERLRSAAPPGVHVEDHHQDVAVLAVQGPASAAVVSAVGLPVSMGYMSFARARRAGIDVTVCRTGYTGELGYELLVPATAAGELWDALMQAGDEAGIQPCGLASRDTLRTEMGYPLHGQDLSVDITPVQARLRWAVGWDKHDFTGKKALVAERAAGPARVLRGLLAEDRSIPRPGMAVRRTGPDVGTAVDAGVVTSGTFSPTLRIGIGLALLDAAVQDGDEVNVDVRGRPGRFVVTKPPFVQASPAS
jgi:aminomethyltransferase